MITCGILIYLVNNKGDWVQGVRNSQCPLCNYFCKYIFQLLSCGDSSVVKVPYKHEDLSSTPKTHEKTRAGGTCLESQCWQGGEI